MNKPLISVIVPVYKVEAYLPRCVDSILGQTHENFELILVDDGSPDGCGALCDRYAQQDERVRVIHQKNAGVSAARNGGLDAAAGDYIAFADSDDWVEPDWLAALLAPLEQDPGAQVSVCGWYREEDGRRLDCSGRIPREPPDGDGAFCNALGAGMQGYLWNKLFRAGLIGGSRLRPDLAVCEDLLFVCTLFCRCEKVAVVPRPLYHYRIRPGSALHQLKLLLEHELRAREAIMEAARGSRRREEAALFSYVQTTMLIARRAELNGDARATALRRAAWRRAPEALRAGSIPLPLRIKLALKLSFPQLISKQYLN